jgi:sugar O-acyltransferase (sialic acid O-acetyltransferase NeuD family)
MKKKLIIYGNGDIAEIASNYFNNSIDYNIECFAVDDDHHDQNTFLGKPLIKFSNLKKNYSSDIYYIHIALSYKELNQIRFNKFNIFKNLNYKFASYISDKIICGINVKFGENCFIQENQVIQDNVTIGNNVIMWAGNHLGHSTKVGSQTYLSSHVVIAGHVEIGERCFFGVNSTVKDFVKIGDDCLIGMSSKVMSNIKSGSIVIERASEIIDSKNKIAKMLKKKL